ncbi:hypothetical protein A5713_26065 [Mycobacterium sp. E2497]|nr:hypothetical protein A5713_26065 [Mycobacterium sp. E2497]
MAAKKRQMVSVASRAVEGGGCVTREPNPQDTRSRIIELTPRGRRALRVMRSSAVDLESRWERILGRRRLAELRETLQALLAGQAETAGE